MPPRVTVIIPTYNWSSVLPYSIGSVLRQTFRDFELLVVGDGCTDDSERVVGAIGDPRVRWINLPQNTGHQSAPNNEGLRQAQGDLIAYLGHDDLWLPGHLAAHVQALDAGGGDAAYSLCMMIQPDGSFWPTIPLADQGGFSPPTCMTHRRTVTEELGGWRDYRVLDERISPDVELFRRIHAAGRKFTFVQRLTGLKFPAAQRRDVYRDRPSHEQAHWQARIDAEPDLEAKLLVECVAGGRVPGGMGYGQLLRYLAGQTAVRVRRRLNIGWFGLRVPWHGTIDQVRRFKGL